MSDELLRLAQGVVVLHAEDTGEVKEWLMAGEDDGDIWVAETLQLALNLVPDLVEAIARARLLGNDVRVVVTHE